MRTRWLILAGWITVLLTGLALRFHDLSVRPMHFDEATGARILADWMEEGEFPFRANHFHGPLNAMGTRGIATLKGEDSWRKLTKGTLRTVPALAGSLLVLTPLLWCRRMGHWAALGSAALLATSPLLVYYSRMYIHESLLAFLAMLTLPVLIRLVLNPSIAIGMLAGVLTGLMWATKETFIISLGAWVLAGVPFLVYGLRPHVPNPGPKEWREYTLSILVLAVSALLVTALLYTNLFREPGRLLDAFRTFLAYETVGGHEKPFTYYLHLLLTPKWRGGIFWTEALVGLCAVTAAVSAFRWGEGIIPQLNRNVILFLALATFLKILLYSAIPYKTPWLMAVPWAHACLLGGGALILVRRAGNHIRWLVIPAFVIVLGYQSLQSLKSINRYASESRNPYAYVPTSGDVESLGTWLEELDAVMQPSSIQPIGVVGRDIWPLPWYLKAFDTVGYYQDGTGFPDNLPVLIALPDAFGVAESRYGSTHIALPRTLRENFPVIVYLHPDLWDEWNAKE